MPTLGETVPGFAFEGFIGVVGPAGMPQDIVMRLNAAANKALQDPDVKKRLVDLGLGIAGGTPEQLHAHMKEQTAQMIRIAKEAGLKPLANSRPPRKQRRISRSQTTSRGQRRKFRVEATT